jgi:hypothetical protein
MSRVINVKIIKNNLKEEMYLNLIASIKSSTAEEDGNKLENMSSAFDAKR